nr:molybdopterin-dependent oxidoreductase [Planctomycetota bacterium]
MSDSARGATTTRTTCCYCGVGCGIVVTKDRAGHLSLVGDTQHPTNRGMLCAKGKALLHAIANRSDRLQWPQMRATRALPLRRTGWDEALARAASEFKRIQAAHGRDSVAFYVSGQCLTEEYAIANKLVKGFLGTNNIDTNSRLCMSSAVAGYKQTLGADGPPISYDDIEVCDTFLVAGANPAWCHPILFRRMEARKAAEPERVRMVVIDPRRTASAAVADLHLQIRPGTDVALFHALARQLDAIGGVDREYIAAHCAGWDELRAAVDPWTLAHAAAYCGLDADDIARCADWLSGDRRFLSLWTMGLNQSAVGTDKNTSLINLSLITGKIGKPGCGPFSLTGQPNAMGGREVGGLANLLPAHRDLADPAQRAEVARQWGVPADRIQSQPGLTAVEMFEAARAGKVKAIWIVCTNPVASLPDAWQVEAALRACDLVVVQDIHATDTTAFADIVLPAATWLEKTGTMTNSERRITLLEPAIQPPGEALPDTEIIKRFAQAMGWGRDFAYADDEAVYHEHVRLTAGTDCDISGVDYARLRRERSLQWPVPAADHAGTPRLYADGRFATPDGRARLRAPAVEDRSEPIDAGFPLVLTTGRVRDQWHTMTRTGRVAKLRAHADVPFCELHPDDARLR